MKAVAVVFIITLVGIIYGGLLIMRAVLNLPLAAEVLTAASVISLLWMQCTGDPDDWHDE